MKKTVTVSNLLKDEVFSSVTTSNATADNKFKTKVTVLENKLENLTFEHTKVVLEYEELKQAVIQLKKEDNLKKNEVKKLVDENKKLNSEIGQLQFDKDKLEATFKANEKREKIKINTRKFNEIIEKQLDDGEVADIDI